MFDPYEEIKNAEFAVEADSFTRLCIWREHENLPDITWEDISIGFGPKIIGYIDERPITVEGFYARINGHLILFYNSPSELVDWKMVRKWINSQCPAAKSNHCDGMNSGHMFNFVRGH